MLMMRKTITVRIYACDNFTLGYLKNLLKTDSNIVLVDTPQAADVTVIQENLLSPTEQKILQAITKHGTISKVAATLNYSPSAVKVYLSRIYSKLKVKTAPQAISFAMKYGLIQLEDEPLVQKDEPSDSERKIKTPKAHS